MKYCVIGLVAVCLSATQGLGAEKVAASKIDAVDLHPDSAEITRIAHCSLTAGETSIVFRGLSPNLREQSLRVSGLEANGVSIRSVSTRRNTQASTTPSPRVQALIDEQQDLVSRLGALDTKQRMIKKVADTQPSVEIGASGSTSAPEFWSSMWTKVAEGLEDTNHRRRDTQKQLDRVTAAINAMRKSDQAIGQSPQTLEVVLDVSADHAAEADIKLVYQVNGASWQPVYDARLHTDHQPAQLDLMRRAEVWQASGEDWSDVVLTLSTSHLFAATAAPTLNQTSDATGNSRDFVVLAPAPAPAEPLRRDFSKSVTKAAFEPSSDGTASYDATLMIPGRATVADGTKAKLFVIGARTTDVELFVRSVPVVDKHAYLQVKFESKDRVPLVPGDVELYRDGTFVGRTVLKGAAPGDEVNLGFGVDDLVSVERLDTRRRERNTTIKAGIAGVERAFKTVVVNRHSFPIRIEIDDREPTFNNVAIVFKELPATTSPTTRDIDGHRGVLAWTYRYAPGETHSLTLAWNVSWPAKLGPIQGTADPLVFRFSEGATF